MVENKNVEMYYIFRCEDCGFNCNWEELASNKSSLVQYALEHYKWDHEFKEISPELHRKIENAIKEIFVEHEEEDFKINW
jgi:predicted small metal-binding protein